MATRTTAISVGPVISTVPVPWNASDAARQKVPWLPRPDIPWFDPKTGKPTAPFAQFMQELAETRLGGISGKSVVQIATTTEQVKAQVVATAEYTEAAVTYTRGVAAQSDALKTVAQANNLDGATTVPPTPDPPARPRAGGLQALP